MANKKGQKGYPKSIQVLAGAKSAEGKTAIEIVKEIKKETGQDVDTRTVRKWINKVANQQDLRTTIQELINKELVKSSLREELNTGIMFKRFLIDEFFKYWGQADENDKKCVRNLLRLVESIVKLEENHLKVLGLTDSLDENITAINDASRRLDEKLGLLKEDISGDKSES